MAQTKRVRVTMILSCCARYTEILAPVEGVGVDGVGGGDLHLYQGVFYSTMNKMARSATRMHVHQLMTKERGAEGHPVRKAQFSYPCC
jgi:hypothetical protein